MNAVQLYEFIDKGRGNVAQETVIGGKKYIF
jgi:hypothetical protein